MERREFFKGIGLLALSPLASNIEKHKKAVEFITSSPGKTIYWAEKSGSDILMDIQAARKMIRESVSEALMVPESLIFKPQTKLGET